MFKLLLFIFRFKEYFFPFLIFDTNISCRKAPPFCYNSDVFISCFFRDEPSPLLSLRAQLSPSLPDAPGARSRQGPEHLQACRVALGPGRGLRQPMASLRYQCRLPTGKYLSLSLPLPSLSVQNTFKPAEWRWDLDEVCDSQCHHYAISVDFPQVNISLSPSHSPLSLSRTPSSPPSGAGTWTRSATASGITTLSVSTSHR